MIITFFTIYFIPVPRSSSAQPDIVETIRQENEGAYDAMTLKNQLEDDENIWAANFSPGDRQGMYDMI